MVPSGRTAAPSQSSVSSMRRLILRLAAHPRRRRLSIFANPVALVEDLGRTGQGIRDTIEHFAAHQNDYAHLSASSHHHPSDRPVRRLAQPMARAGGRWEDANRSGWP